MLVNKKQIKRMLKRRNKNNQLSRFDLRFNKIPYNEKTNYQINYHGRELMTPIVNYLSKYKDFNHRDSRLLSFTKLKEDRYHRVKLCGIITNYRIVYYKHWNQAEIYLLLTDVAGLTFSGRYEYLTDHLWIDPNLSNYLLGSILSVGIGDVAFLKGSKSVYSGRVGKLHGQKMALNNAFIIANGYPIIKNHRFQYECTPYNHKNQCIYHTANTPSSSKLYFGNELRSNDRSVINDGKYEFSNEPKLHLFKTIKKGLKKDSAKDNEFLIYKAPLEPNGSYASLKVYWSKNHNNRCHRLTTVRKLHEAYADAKRANKPLSIPDGIWHRIAPINNAIRSDMIKAQMESHANAWCINEVASRFLSNQK